MCIYGIFVCDLYLYKDIKVYGQWVHVILVLTVAGSQE